MGALTILDPTIGTATQTGLALRLGLKFEQWAEIGEDLRRLEKAALWWIGDWLNYGERSYGETYAQALDATDYSQGALQNAKWVASKVETSRRREDLPWSVHYEVASLPPEQQDDVLGEAERDRLTVRDVRELVNALKRGIGEPPPLPPPGKYTLIYADPPWRYDYSKADSRRIENQYPTMELDAIRALDVAGLTHDTCVLFLWATSPKLADAMTVIEAWGFEYRTCAVWDKEVIGMGYYFRQQHELLLVATHGDPTPPLEAVRSSSVIRSRRGEHSVKPLEFYELIERMYPDAVRLELFARSAREGWQSWGNQRAA